MAPPNRPYRRPPRSRFAPQLPSDQNPLHPAATLPPLDGGSQTLLNSGTNNAKENFNHNNSYAQTNLTFNSSGDESPSSQQQHGDPPSTSQDLPLHQQQPLPPPPPLPSFPPSRRPPRPPLLRQLLVYRAGRARMNRQRRNSDRKASNRQEREPPVKTTSQELSRDREGDRVKKVEETSLREKRDRKRQKREENLKQHRREHSDRMLEKGEGSNNGSHMDDRRSQLISGDGPQNQLRPTMFICNTNRPEGGSIPLDPEDEALLRDDDDDSITPITTDDMKRKERPTDGDLSPPVKTLYSSPLSLDSTKGPETEKHAKRLRESRDQDCLSSQDKREKDVQVIMDSSKACKSSPVHVVNGQLKPSSVQPVFPCFDGHDGQFAVVKSSTDPKAGLEIPRAIEAYRVQHQHGATGESCVGSSSNAEKPDECLVYSKPPVDEAAAGNASIICSTLQIGTADGSLMRRTMQDVVAKNPCGAEDDNIPDSD